MKSIAVLQVIITLGDSPRVRVGLGSCTDAPGCSSTLLTVKSILGDVLFPDAIAQCFGACETVPRFVHTIRFSLLWTVPVGYCCRAGLRSVKQSCEPAHEGLLCSNTQNCKEFRILQVEHQCEQLKLLKYEQRPQQTSKWAKEFSPRQACILFNPRWMKTRSLGWWCFVLGFFLYYFILFYWSSIVPWCLLSIH